MEVLGALMFLWLFSAIHVDGYVVRVLYNGVEQGYFDVYNSGRNIYICDDDMAVVQDYGNPTERIDVNYRRWTYWKGEYVVDGFPYPRYYLSCLTFFQDSGSYTINYGYESQYDYFCGEGDDPSSRTFSFTCAAAATPRPATPRPATFPPYRTPPSTPDENGNASNEGMSMGAIIGTALGIFGAFSLMILGILIWKKKHGGAVDTSGEAGGVYAKMNDETNATSAIQ